MATSKSTVIEIMLGGTSYEVHAADRSDLGELEGFADQLLAVCEHIAAGLGSDELEDDFPDSLWSVLRTARSILAGVREARGEQAALTA